MKLLNLLRRRRLAYDLLAEYDSEHLPVDPERFKRSMEILSKWAAYPPVVGTSSDGATRWAAAVKQLMDKYPAA